MRELDVVGASVDAIDDGIGRALQLVVKAALDQAADDGNVEAFAGEDIAGRAAFDAARDDVSVIGLAYEEIEPEAMRAFLVKHPAGYPIALLDVYSPPADFATPRGLPMTYLIAPDGTVADRFLGPVTSQELAAAIDKASAADTSKPDYIDGTMAFMFEARQVLRPTRQALDAAHRQRDYQACWAGLSKRFVAPGS
mgnify:CR=1 FL=1